MMKATKPQIIRKTIPSKVAIKSMVNTNPAMMNMSGELD